MRVMAIYSPIRWSARLLDYIAENADQFDTVEAVYVIERTLIEQWARRWSAEGWLGQAASTKVVETILNDFHQRADDYRGLIESAASRPIEHRVVDHDFVSTILQMARDHHIDRILMVRRMQPRWIRRWMRTSGEQIKKGAPCPVISIEPEK